MSLVINGHKFAGNADSSPAFHLAKQYREAELNKKVYAVFERGENDQIEQLTVWTTKKNAEEFLNYSNLGQFILKLV